MKLRTKANMNTKAYFKKGIMTNNWDYCYLCGNPYGLEKHHCMHGTANRKLAEKYGLYVPLCNCCHGTLQNGKYGREMDLKLMRKAQEEFEKKYSHEEWMEIFKKNYL
jgi:hypothetical protein